MRQKTIVQTVCFEKIATGFDNDVRVDSSLRSIQRFMSGYLLDINLIACLVFALLPHKPPYRLALDRTNWKFGSTNINILVLAVVYQGVAFPIMFTMMPKFGNSSTSERIELMQRYINLFGIQINQDEFFPGIVSINSQLCYLSGSKVKNKKGVPELQVIDSFNKPDEV